MAKRPHPLRQVSSRRGLHRSVIWISIAFVVALPLLVSISLWSLYQQTVRGTEVKASDFANILAEHMRSVVGEVDASLKQLVLQNARLGGPTASSDNWLPVLRAALAGISQVGSLSVVDDRGVIRHSTLPLLIGQSRSDQYLFKRLATDRRAGIVADAPFRSLVDQRILIPLGRRLEGPDGSFVGAVVATLTPEAFRDFYKSVDVGRDGIIWVVHPTGLVLCSEPVVRSEDGEFAALPPPLIDAMREAEVGKLRAGLQANGPTLTSAWRSLPEPPITIVVSFSLPEALSAWRRRAFASAAVVLLLALVLSAGSIQLVRHLRAREAAEQALMQRDQELVEAQRMAGLGSARIFVPDMRVRLSSQLASMLELTHQADNCALEALLGRFIESDRLRLSKAIDLCRASGIRYSLELSARLGNDTARILHSEGVLSNDGSNILAIFADVTERRLADLRATQDERMAALGRLTGGVAHDFNNLLTAIIGYGDLSLHRLTGGEPIKRDIEEIVKAGRRAAELTQQLLAFSRTQVLQPKVIDLNRIVADIQPMLARLIGEDIQLDATLDSQLGAVKVDPSQIEQVIVNLTVNARDAMPNGGRLAIETSNCELDESYTQSQGPLNPGPYIVLAISDTGNGIERDLIPHIFEPFFTTKDRGKGTGLGLATVYGIVKQSGGNVWVYSEPGKGTTFKIYLPRVNVGEAIERNESRSPSAESLRGSETILVVEDQQSVRKLVRTALERQGYRVLEAENGQDALQLFSQHSNTIKLVLTDIVMPGMSGPDLARNLRSGGKEVLVLYMSGYTDDAMVTRGLLDPDIPFIQKPFSPAALSRKVREVLDASF